MTVPRFGKRRELDRIADERHAQQQVVVVARERRDHVGAAAELDERHQIAILALAPQLDEALRGRDRREKGRLHFDCGVERRRLERRLHAVDASIIRLMRRPGYVTFSATSDEYGSARASSATASRRQTARTECGESRRKRDSAPAREQRRQDDADDGRACARSPIAHQQHQHGERDQTDQRELGDVAAPVLQLRERYVDQSAAHASAPAAASLIAAIPAVVLDATSRATRGHRMRAPQSSRGRDGRRRALRPARCRGSKAGRYSAVVNAASARCKPFELSAASSLGAVSGSRSSAARQVVGGHRARHGRDRSRRRGRAEPTAGRRPASRRSLEGCCADRAGRAPPLRPAAIAASARATRGRRVQPSARVAPCTARQLLGHAVRERPIGDATALPPSTVAVRAWSAASSASTRTIAPSAPNAEREDREAGSDRKRSDSTAPRLVAGRVANVRRIRRHERQHLDRHHRHHVRADRGLRASRRRRRGCGCDTRSAAAEC